VARRGSYSDGGAFRFSVTESDGLLCRNKFGVPVTLTRGQHHRPAGESRPGGVDEAFQLNLQERILDAYESQDASGFFHDLERNIAAWGWGAVRRQTDRLLDFGRGEGRRWEFARQALTLLRDRHYPTGEKRRASVIALLDQTLGRLFRGVPLIIDEQGRSVQRMRRLDWDTRHGQRPPAGGVSILVLDTQLSPAEGKESAARWMARAYDLGWQHLIASDWRGGRFAACGLGPHTADLRVDLYGDVGDYAGSGLDGAQIYLHGDGQDQLGQIVKSGKLVV
jgi:hypothetical protein